MECRVVYCVQKKDSSAQVNDFRPITLVSMFYRIYGGVRAGQILSQLASRPTNFRVVSCEGARRKICGTLLVLALRCHTNRVQPPLVQLLTWLRPTIHSHVRPPFIFCVHLGSLVGLLIFGLGILIPSSGSFLVGRNVGSAVGSSSGFPEGCPLSCVAMAALDLAWHKFQSIQSPQTLHLSFVDNLEILGCSWEALSNGLRALASFCSLFDLQVDQASLYTWSSSEAGRLQLRAAGQVVSLGQRDLGGQVAYCQQLRNRVLQDRIVSVLPYFPKLRSSGFPIAVKISNLVQVLWPRALHGCEAVPIGSQHVHRLRSGTI